MKPRMFSSHSAFAALPPRSRTRPGGIVAATACAVAALAAVPASGQVAVTLNGPPVQVRPYVPEPGLPDVTIPLGTLNPFPSDPSGGGSPGDPSGGGGGGGGGSPGNVAPSDSLSTMLIQPWGIAAVANAQSIGVNPSALAATCVLESGCQNVSGGTYTGAFQMGLAAYTDGLATAESINSSLASQVVPGDGRSDPTSAAIAAAGYLIQGARALQAAGIANPTVLDVRSYYNFTPTIGVQVARANDSDSMSNYLSPAVMQANRITPNETVGQWRTSISTKIGTAAGQTVMI